MPLRAYCVRGPWNSWWTNRCRLRPLGEAPQGHIEQFCGKFRAVVSVGTDPPTGNRRVLRGSLYEREKASSGKRATAACAGSTSRQTPPNWFSRPHPGEPPQTRHPRRKRRPSSTRRGRNQLGARFLWVVMVTGCRARRALRPPMIRRRPRPRQDHNRRRHDTHIESKAKSAKPWRVPITTDVFPRSRLPV